MHHESSLLSFHSYGTSISSRSDTYQYTSDICRSASGRCELAVEYRPHWKLEASSHAGSQSIVETMSSRMLSLVTLVLALSSPSQAFAVSSPARFTSKHNGRARSLIQSVPAGGDTPPPELKPPPALYQGAVAAGAAKASAPFGKIFTLGVAAGCHIAFGAYLAISVGGACPGLAETNPGLQKLITGGMGLYVLGF